MMKAVLPAPDRPPTIQCGVRSLKRSTSGVSPSCPTTVPSPSAASPLQNGSEASSGRRSAKVTCELAAECAASSRQTASIRYGGGSSSRNTGAFSHFASGIEPYELAGGSPITAYGLRSETDVVRGSAAWVVSAVSGGG